MLREGYGEREKEREGETDSLQWRRSKKGEVAGTQVPSAPRILAYRNIFFRKFAVESPHFGKSNGVF